MSIFLRKRYLIKPKMRLFQRAQMDLFNNCNKMGIDPLKIVRAVPFWEGGGSVIHDYGWDSSIAIFQNQPTWKGSIFNTTGSVGAYFPNDNPYPLPVLENKVTMLMRVANNNIGQTSTYPVSAHKNTYNFLYGYETNKYETFWNDGTIRHDIQVISDTDFHQIGAAFDGAIDIFKGYFDGKETISTSETGTLVVPGGSNRLTYIGNSNSAAWFDGDFDTLLMVADYLSGEIIGRLSENPYELYQPSTEKSYFFIEEIPTQVSTPVIDPTSGEYESTQEITITCGTSGSTIYYTEDGSDPDETDTEYTVPFTLGSEKTIKAMGIAAGLDDSEIVSETYTISIGVDIQPIIFIIT